MYNCEVEGGILAIGSCIFCGGHLVWHWDYGCHTFCVHCGEHLCDLITAIKFLAFVAPQLLTSASEKDLIETA